MTQTAADTPIVALTKWATALRFNDIPKVVVTKSEQLIMDTLGVAIAATTDPVGLATDEWVNRFAAPGGCAVFGSSRRVAATDAAFANGTLAHALDFDDHGFGGHASSCVLNAVLAAAELSRLDSQSVLTSYVAGMEAFGRLAIAMPWIDMHGYGFHPTAVLGLVGAAVGAAKAMGLTEQQTAHAVAISTIGGAGVTASFGTMVKPLHAGHTAAAGVQAAQLALSGFTGNLAVFESEHGFGTAYTRDTTDWSLFLDALDGPYRLEVQPPSVKPFACCGGNQRSIQNLSRIMSEHGLADRDVAKVDVHVNPKQLVTLRYPWPTSAYEAKFCLPFTLATTLSHDGPTLAAFAGEYWNNDLVLNARERITVIPDLTAHKNHVVVEVITTDGRQFSRSDDVVHGSASDPMTWDQISQKYNDNCGYSKIAPETAAALHDSLKNMGEAAPAEAGDEFWRALEAVGGPA